MKPIWKFSACALLAFCVSCGLLSEENRSTSRGPVVGDQGTPDRELPPGGSADAQLGERADGIQKIVVRTRVRPVELSSASQFDLVFNPAEIVPATASFSELSVPVISAGKTIACNQSLKPDTVRCIVYGINKNLIPNGDLATLRFTVVDAGVSEPQFRLENLIMSTPDARPVPLSR
ncbi:MAG: hypothetical protein K2X47_11990 [Bdellovibrionales bacterium]|nr:hypothetical protein [Bdellovibrionales bacterium]